jgi:hypothetical protein
MLMCESKGRHLVINSSYHTIISLSSIHVFTTLRTYLGLPHPKVAHLSQCQCDHTIDNLRIHLLQCPCRNEHIATHNTLWDMIAAIVLESGTHVKKEVSHLPSSHLMTSGYPYHYKQLPNFDGCCHC